MVPKKLIFLPIIPGDNIMAREKKKNKVQVQVDLISCYPAPSCFVPSKSLSILVTVCAVPILFISKQARVLGGMEHASSKSLPALMKRLIFISMTTRDDRDLHSSSHQDNTIEVLS